MYLGAVFVAPPFAFILLPPSISAIFHFMPKPTVHRRPLRAPRPAAAFAVTAVASQPHAVGLRATSFLRVAFLYVGLAVECVVHWLFAVPVRCIGGGYGAPVVQVRLPGVESMVLLANCCDSNGR